MTTPRIQSFTSLRDEMIAVAKGERKAPAHAAAPSVHSAEVIARLLTPENRELMSLIRDEKPDSVAALAQLTHRAASNLTRTLDKLVAVGLVMFVSHGRKKAPRTVAKKITIEIDPFSPGDTVRVTPALLAAHNRRRLARGGKRASSRSIQEKRRPARP